MTSQTESIRLTQYTPLYEMNFLRADEVIENTLVIAS